MTGFVTAINRRGEKQRIPADWLDERSPFAKDFRLPPSQRTGEPSADWTKNDLLAHAARHHIDVGDATTKADILQAITAA